MKATKKAASHVQKRPEKKEQTRKQTHGPEKHQEEVTATPSKASDEHYKNHQGGH